MDPSFGDLNTQISMPKLAVAGQFVGAAGPRHGSSLQDHVAVTNFNEPLHILVHNDEGLTFISE
jgi:hypothetical protein